MFDVGFSEILVISGLSLVVLGPDKLPSVARKLGHWAGRARAMARQFRDQLEAEADTLKSQADLGLNTRPVDPMGPPPPGAAATPPPPHEFTGAPADAPPPAAPPADPPRPPGPTRGS